MKPPSEDFRSEGADLKFEAGGAISTGPASGNGYEILLQGFNWDSCKQGVIDILRCSFVQFMVPFRIGTKSLLHKRMTLQRLESLQFGCHLPAMLSLIKSVLLLSEIPIAYICGLRAICHETCTT